MPRNREAKLVNYLRTLRERAQLTQLALAGLLEIDNTIISRLERASKDQLAGQRALIIRVAAACGASPTDVELQLFLLRIGNAPWLPEDEATLREVASFAAQLGSVPPPIRETGRPHGRRSWWFEPGALAEEEAR